MIPRDACPSRRYSAKISTRSKDIAGRVLPMTGGDVIRQQPVSENKVERMQTPMHRTPEETRDYAERTVGAFYDAISQAEQLDTVAALKRMVMSNSRAVAKLTQLYAVVDKAFRHASGLAACARGCSHCCYIGVRITGVEADLIAEHIGLAPSDVQGVQPRDPKSFSRATPCPFLKNEECSIYERRPFECRANFNFDRDSYWCRYENWDKPGASVPKPVIAPIAMAYTAITQATPRGRVVADIRDFFPGTQVDAF